MTDASATLAADESLEDTPPPAPKVKVILTSIEGAGLDVALATVARQVYEAVEQVTVVGSRLGALPDGVLAAGTIEEAISTAGPDIDYLWFLHADARPRPDALSALVTELTRSDASLGGSKILVAGTPGELESIGSATDVFGEPYSGLDEGEIDLEQYDVVREVAFISSVSMLVRRDVAQGLGGPDESMPPVAAGLDFSQRVRLTGGRVEIVPSSEVYHQGKCEEATSGWREEAGRLRAMLKAYRVLTLLWFVPYALLVMVADSVASLLLLRWQPLVRHVMSWLWNLLRLPSTILARRRLKRVRAVGDEELFRFQARGSVRMREVGLEVSERVLFMFDEDQALARGSRRIWSSPGIWGALLAGALAVFSARSFFFASVPNISFSFPLEPPTVALERFLGGWNESGLGTPWAVHPSVGPTALVSVLFLGNVGAARTVLTITFALLGVVGMGRLAGRLGYRGPGRYLAGLVLLAGPGTALLVGAGSWFALAAAAVLPWAARAVFLHPDDLSRGPITHVGWVVIWSILLATLSPLLAIVPFLAMLLWRLAGGRRARFWLGVASMAGIVAGLAFLLGDPGWVVDGTRRLNVVGEAHWPVLIALAALPILFVENRTSRLAGVGAVFGLSGLALAAYPIGGPGIEEAGLVVASFGAAIVVAAAFDLPSWRPHRFLAALSALAMVVLSVVSLADGRLGLPPGDDNSRLAFAETLAGEGGPGRILFISDDRHLVPGEARSGPGFWYRTVDGRGTTLDEVWLPEPLMGDEELDATLRRIASGAELRPGALLAEYGIGWVFIDGPAIYLEEVLESQLDLIPTPLAEGSLVYENAVRAPLAAEGVEIWSRSGTGFVGDEGSGRVTIAMNYDGGWSPDPARVGWRTSVAATSGESSYSGGGRVRALAVATAALFLASMLAIAVEKVRG